MTLKIFSAKLHQLFYTTHVQISSTIVEKFMKSFVRNWTKKRSIHDMVWSGLVQMCQDGWAVDLWSGICWCPSTPSVGELLCQVGGFVFFPGTACFSMDLLDNAGTFRDFQRATMEDFCRSFEKERIILLSLGPSGIWLVLKNTVKCYSTAKKENKKMF